MLDLVHLCRLGKQCPRITHADGGNCPLCKQCPRLRYTDGGFWLPLRAVASAALPDISFWQIREDCKQCGIESYRVVSDAEHRAMRDSGLAKGRPCAVARHEIMELILKRRGVSDDFCRDLSSPGIPVQVLSPQWHCLFTLSIYLYSFCCLTFQLQSQLHLLLLVLILAGKKAKCCQFSI